MKKEKRLDKKIRRLFRMAGHPRWVHRMGPKKFETGVLCLGLIIKQVYQFYLRRIDRVGPIGRPVQLISLVEEDIEN